MVLLKLHLDDVCWNLYCVHRFFQLWPLSIVRAVNTIWRNRPTSFKHEIPIDNVFDRHLTSNHTAIKYRCPTQKKLSKSHSQTFAESCWFVSEKSEFPEVKCLVQLNSSLALFLAHDLLNLVAFILCTFNSDLWDGSWTIPVVVGESNIKTFILNPEAKY